MHAQMNLLSYLTGRGLLGPYISEGDERSPLSWVVDTSGVSVSIG